MPHGASSPGGPRSPGAAVAIRGAGLAAIAGLTAAGGGAANAGVQARDPSGGTPYAEHQRAPAVTAPPALTLAPGPRGAGAPRLETATGPQRVFLGARRKVSFSFRIGEVAATGARVDLVRADDGALLRSWSPAAPAPGAVARIRWSGRLGRALAPAGAYAFRLTVTGPGGATAFSSAPADTRRDAFELRDFRFPVRASHDFGAAAAVFGAVRSGHSHQGHDVFARCGARLVAARGGRVLYAGYQGSAGNYVVVDSAGTAPDAVYMNLATASALSTGDRVLTGQTIGAVGETGNAQGCHLHFELWSAPGWYRGGARSILCPPYWPGKAAARRPVRDWWRRANCLHFHARAAPTGQSSCWMGS